MQRVSSNTLVLLIDPVPSFDFPLAPPKRLTRLLPIYSESLILVIMFNAPLRFWPEESTEAGSFFMFFS
jgi:hypothetical protein